jgi:hypothetical protein
MQFFFLGESQSNPREIEVDTDGSLYDLQSLIAAHFAIVEPQGMSTLWRCPTPGRVEGS